MTTRKTILVALDDSEASQRVLSYTAEQAKASEGLQVLLCHVLPSMPPELLESRGAEDPDEERRIEAAQQQAQMRWIAEQTGPAAQVLEHARRRLATLGVPAARIHTTLVERVHVHGGVAEAILATAKAAHCDAIIVGRQAFFALREVLHTHLADVLEANTEGLAVHIVD